MFPIISVEIINNIIHITLFYNLEIIILKLLIQKSVFVLFEY